MGENNMKEELALCHSIQLADIEQRLKKLEKEMAKRRR